MTIQSLDISKKLAAEGMDLRIAEAVATAIVAANESADLQLATKQDLLSLKTELKADNEKLRSEFKIEHEKLRSELKTDHDKLDNSIHIKFETFRLETRSEFAKIRSDADLMKTDMLLAIEKSRNQLILSIAGIAALVFVADKLVN